MCGVYYLWDGAEVIYIGSSRNVERRISQHRATGLDFCAYFVDKRPRARLREYEANAIAEFSPKLNVTSVLTFQG